MRIPVLLSSLLVSLIKANPQDEDFEPSNFDAIQVLHDKGVDVQSSSLSSGVAANTSTSSCQHACATLRSFFGLESVLASDESAYNASTTYNYWSAQQASVAPYCVFKPHDAADVSTLVLVSRWSKCPFAVRSGGHAAFAGSSNIQGGITVQLERLNAVTLSQDQKIASIQSGQTWYDVYTKLQDRNLTVIGGRVAAIGVGGLTLGGGISFFSNQYGWACDNVVAYEVVTASGRIVNASLASYPDLYWALRGGGNNFGIVTKFHLSIIPQGLMWGGGRLHTVPQFDAVLEAFHSVGTNSAQDPAAAQILSFAYAQGQSFAQADLQYAQPVGNATIFQPYLAIPPLVDTTRVRTLADLTLQFNASNPSGLRETYWAASFKLDRNLTRFVKDVFFDEIRAITNASGLIPAATLQVITVPQLTYMAKNGGNPLGLSPASGPLLLLNLNMMWTDIADDTRILRVNARIVQRAVAEARRRGLDNDYIYQNYASQYQAVIPSYGAENQKRLQGIARRYDPEGVFQELQPGYFKLDGAPAVGSP